MLYPSRDVWFQLYIISNCQVFGKYFKNPHLILQKSTFDLFLKLQNFWLLFIIFEKSSKPTSPNLENPKKLVFHPFWGSALFRFHPASSVSKLQNCDSFQKFSNFRQLDSQSTRGFKIRRFLKWTFFVISGTLTYLTAP